MEKRSRILVVDDEDRNLRLMEAMLLPLGYQVILAQNGEEAFEKVKETPPDVILLDVMMPKMDGFEVAQRLKSNEETRIIPIVMVTALREVEDRVKALEIGVNDFLSKPVDKIELRATVASQVQIKAYHDHMKNYQAELTSEVARRTEQLRQALDRIEVASRETIHRLSRAAEFKDQDTAAHILRMSRYSEAVSRQMGLGENVTRWIIDAASMHDVGKIGTPDHILLKPGKLDPDEWEIMKEHTLNGGRILEGADMGFVRMAEVIALTHHEKWDGSGYPRGLKGKQIPLVGRITAIADVFDALTSSRPYKAPFSVEKSFAIILDGRGTHFDPDVVDAFFAIKDEILSIKEKYKDKGESLLVKTAGKALD